jgi:hypothetical protein
MNYFEHIYESIEDRHTFDTVYHGTDSNSARDIMRNGIDISKVSGGYFGWAFYTTEDYNLAKSNYADWAEEEDVEGEGVILKFKVDPSAKILDLRREDDWDFYVKTQHDKHYHTLRGSLRIYNQFGVDAIYDRSNNSLMVFNPKILTLEN